MNSIMLSRVWALLPVLTMSCPERERVVVLWAAAEVKGTVAPCGCTTDPLGGLDRAAALIRADKRAHGLATAGPVERDPEAAQDPARRAEADAKADLLAKTFSELGWLRPGLHELGGLKIAILSGLSPRPAGVDLAVALLDLPHAEARRALRAAQGIDLAVLGHGVGLGQATPEQVGETWLFAPADQLQKLHRIEIHVRPGSGRLRYAGGAGEIEKLDQRIASLEPQLAAWRQAPDADAAFVAEREKELAELRAQRARRAHSGGIEVPAQGSWFSSALVAVRQKLPSDPQVRLAMQELDRRVGEDNRTRDCAEKRPPQIEPHYVGMASCGQGGCHPKAVALWKQTVHAHAWKTLFDTGRAFSHDCFSCHVTGADEAARAGATLCKPEPLQDVQCEVCHGPASAHVAAGGIEDVSTMTKRPPDGLCALRCHTPEHSDTFQLEAYLRDILGEGHGAKRRAQLGAGATGHELRLAGLRKAGRAP